MKEELKTFLSPPDGRATFIQKSLSPDSGGFIPAERMRSRTFSPGDPFLHAVINLSDTGEKLFSSGLKRSVLLLRLPQSIGPLSSEKISSSDPEAPGQKYPFS